MIYCSMYQFKSCRSQPYEHCSGARSTKAKETEKKPDFDQDSGEQYRHANHNRSLSGSSRPVFFPTLSIEHGGRSSDLQAPCAAF